MYKGIVIEDNGEERIRYPDEYWQHIVLKTTLDHTFMEQIPIHWHSALQFVFVLKGRLTIRISDKNIVLNTGEGVFINSNIVHEIQGLENISEFYCWNIEIPDIASYLEYKYISYVSQHAEMIPYIHLSHKNVVQRELLADIESVGNIYQKQAMHFKLDIMVYFYKILKWLVKYLEQQPAELTYHFDDRVKQMMSYIHKHFQDKITLCHLSQSVYLSEAEAIRLFKKYVKQTPFEYLLRYRLEQSKYVIDKDKQSTITEIAMACGFSTTSYFIKVFKARYGMTPKQYQKYQHIKEFHHK